MFTSYSFLLQEVSQKDVFKTIRSVSFWIVHREWFGSIYLISLCARQTKWYGKLPISINRSAKNIDQILLTKQIGSVTPRFLITLEPLKF